MFPNAKENVEGCVVLVGATGGPDIDGAVEVASAGLSSIVPPPVFPNENVDFGGFDDAAGVVVNALLVPDPLPALFINPLPNTGFAGVLDDAPPAELITPKGDPPPVIFNLNLGAAAPADSAGAGVEAGGLKLNVDSAGLGGSGAAVELKEVPNAGIDAELFVNPKLNLGTGPLVVGPAVVDSFWGVLEVPVAFGGPLAMFEGLKANVAFVNSLAVFDGPKTEVGLAGSATRVFVFPNENGEPLGVVVPGAVKGCEVGCTVANPPIRPSNDPPPSVV
jgi:hypothetical protein